MRTYKYIRVFGPLITTLTVVAVLLLSIISHLDALAVAAEAEELEAQSTLSDLEGRSKDQLLALLVWIDGEDIKGYNRTITTSRKLIAFYELVLLALVLGATVQIASLVSLRVFERRGANAEDLSGLWTVIAVYSLMLAWGTYLVISDFSKFVVDGTVWVFGFGAAAQVVCLVFLARQSTFVARLLLVLAVPGIWFGFTESSYIRVLPIVFLYLALEGVAATNGLRSAKAAA